MRLGIFAIASTLVFISSIQTLCSSERPDAWTKAKSFNKSLADGPLHAPLVDPISPPPVDLISLSWNGERLKAIADFYNLGTLPIKVDGREISDSIGVSYFHPYAELQVSDEMKGPWKTIGHSPPSDVGTPATVLMLPNAPKSQKFPHNAFCAFKMDPFRPWVEKAKYCRVLLRGGQESQVIALVDLLPPKQNRRR